MVALFARIFPGLFVAVIIAVVSVLLGQSLPVIGSSVLALGIGLLVNLFMKNSHTKLAPGLQFTSKTVLRVAIILLGSSLSISEIYHVGRYSVYVMLFTLTAAFGFGYLFGYLLKVNWKMSTLISAGTGICGGSAIMAIAPVIDGEPSDVTYSIAATFIFDVLMIILFPIAGRWLGLSDLAYGLWTGTAVNDTSSVVAAGYAFSEAAGDFATIVKLTRTLSIIPVVLLFSVVGVAKKGKEQVGESSDFNKWAHLRQVTPWFILWFVVFAGINSLGLIPAGLGHTFKLTSRFFMTMALGAIGLSTDMEKLTEAGWAPMFLGFIVSAIVVVVSLMVQFGLGQL